MKKTTLYIAILFCLFYKSGLAQNQLPAGLKKLAGGWVGTSGQSKVLESWMLVNPHMMYGSGATINEKGDTVQTESLKISIIRGMTFYIPSIRVNGKIKSTPFMLEKEEESYWRFTNNSHDFPKTIEYWLTDINHMKASISGPDENGGTKTIEFIYERFKKQ
jgi:hypothetical protein